MAECIFFKNARFFVTNREWKDAHRFGASFFGGYHKKHFEYPNFSYELIDFTLMREAGAFQIGYDLFRDRTLILVPTPGHTRGHQSLLIYGNQPVCIAGDAVFSQHHLTEGIVDGIASHHKLSIQSINKLREWSRMHDAPVLGAHDPHAKLILEERKFI